MNRQFQFRGFQGRGVQLGGWRAIVAMALAGALGVALLLTLGLLLLVLVPVFLVLGFAARWWLGRELKKQMARRPAPSSPGAVALEGDYEVVEVERVMRTDRTGRGWGPK